MRGGFLQNNEGAVLIWVNADSLLRWIVVLLFGVPQNPTKLTIEFTVTVLATRINLLYAEFVRAVDQRILNEVFMEFVENDYKGACVAVMKQLVYYLRPLTLNSMT